MNEKLKELKKSIKWKLKGTHVSILSQSDIASTKEWIATPSYDLNRIMSGSLKKGLPNKTLTLFIGPETSGKSSLMALCLKNAQEHGYTPVVIDTEGSWDKEFVERWGLDSDEILYVYTPWIDQICTALGNIISANDEKIALVIDSIGGIERMKLIDDTQSDGVLKSDQGMLQREIKKMLKMVLYIAKNQNSFALCSGHYYGSPSTYGSAEEIGGGKFMKLAPDVIVSLKKEKILDDNKKVIGNKIKAITSKNRYYPPFSEAEISLNFIDGIDKWAGMLDLAINAGIVTQKGSWYSIEEKKLGQGSKNAIEGLKGVENVIDTLDKWLKKTGYSTVNEYVKAAEELLGSEEEQKGKKKGEK